MGSTKRRRLNGRRPDPVARQFEGVLQKSRDERQADLARQKIVNHPEYVEGSTSALLALRIIDSFTSARKTETKNKTRIAKEEGVRRLRMDHPARYEDKASLKIGERIARECLREAGNEVYRNENNTPPSAR